MQTIIHTASALAFLGWLGCWFALAAGHALQPDVVGACAGAFVSGTGAMLLTDEPTGQGGDLSGRASPGVLVTPQPLNPMETHHAEH